MSDTQSLSALAANIELPVEISISNKYWQYFICKIPQSDIWETQKCVRFRVLSHEKLADGEMQFSIVCSCCRSKQPSFPYVWKSDGLTVSRPLENHLPTRCRPLVYDDVIKDGIRDEVKEKILRGESIEMHIPPFGSPFVQSGVSETNKTRLEGGPTANESNVATGSGSELSATPSELPVIVVANRKIPEQLSFICRLTSDPGKCLQFEMVDSEMLADGSVEFTVECSKCANAYGGIPDFHPKRKSNGFVVVGPLDNHLPKCNYWNYRTLLWRNPVVFDQVKEKILKGQEIDMYLPPQAFPFPISEKFRRAYERKEGRQLMQIVDRARDMEKERDESTEVEAGQQDSLNRREKPKYPVEISRGGDGKDSSPEWRPFFIYRLENRPGKCYRFVVKNYRKDADGVTFLVQCAGCQSIFADIVKGVRPFQSVSITVRTTAGLLMNDDPSIGHIENCVPFDYLETIRTCPLATNEFKKLFLMGNNDAIKGRVPAPKKKYTSAPLPLLSVGRAPLSSTLVDMLNQQRENTVDMVNSSRKRKASRDVHEESTTVTYPSRNPDSTVPESRGSDSLVIAESSHSSVSNIPSDATPKTAKPRQLHGISVPLPQPPFAGAELTAAIKEEVDIEVIEVVPSVVASPVTSPAELPVSIPVSVRKIQLAVPMKFEKKFDAFIFTEEEVDISVDGNVLRVQFERKSAIGVSRSSHQLVYEHELPAYVVPDSLSTRWENGQLIVVANTTST